MITACVSVGPGGAGCCPYVCGMSLIVDGGCVSSPDDHGYYFCESEVAPVVVCGGRLDSCSAAVP